MQTEGQMRLQWRCRRGMLELDLLLQHFLLTDYADLNQAEQQAFEQLLMLSDARLFDYFFAKLVPEEKELTDVVQRIRACIVA